MLDQSALIAIAATHVLRVFPPPPEYWTVFSQWVVANGRYLHQQAFCYCLEKVLALLRMVVEVNDVSLLKTVMFYILMVYINGLHKKSVRVYNGYGCCCLSNFGT